MRAGGVVSQGSFWLGCGFGCFRLRGLPGGVGCGEDIWLCRTLGGRTWVATGAAVVLWPVLGVVRQGGLLAMVVALLVLLVLSGGGVALAVVGAAPGSSADLVVAAAGAAAVGVLASA